MGALLLHWLISAVSLLIVAYIIPGIQVQGFGTALIAAIVIGLVNATLGFVLKILTLPLTLLTFGLFWFVINALMLNWLPILYRAFPFPAFGSLFLAPSYSAS